MLDEKIRRSVSSGEGAGLFAGRLPQAPYVELPAGTILVSSDNHFPLTEDIFYERFPKHLKEKAPRIWWDEKAGVRQIGFNHVPLIPDSAFPLIHSMEDRPGARNLRDRMKDFDAEGVHSEIVFPQLISMFFKLPDLEVREWVFKSYNAYMAELQRQEPDRFFPVGMINYWDPSKTVESIHEFAAHGLKGIMLPLEPGKRIDGSTIVWSDPEHDAMWSLIEELDVPTTIHVGEGFGREGLNGEGARLLQQTGPSLFRKAFGHLVYGLVFDKHPKLKVVFAEAGINWVAGLLQDAEMISNHHATMFDSRPKHRPSHYWHEHCYATFQDDPVGFRSLDIIGADRIMWAVDYPHNEGIFGYTHDVIESIVAAVSEDEARMILGGTCKQVFKI